MQRGFQEKRTAPRSRVFFGAEILRGLDLPSIDCHVKNVSRGGANIVIPTGELVPDQFDFIIRKTNERHHAVAVWSRGWQVGIAYRPRSSVVVPR